MNNYHPKHRKWNTYHPRSYSEQCRSFVNRMIDEEYNAQECAWVLTACYDPNTLRTKRIAHQIQHKVRKGKYNGL